jgi:hypothetical protein
MRGAKKIFLFSELYSLAAVGKMVQVEKDNKILPVITLVLGWLAAVGTLSYAIITLEFNWNFLGFSANLNVAFFAEMTGALAANIAIWFLARASRAISMLLCAVLVEFALAGLRADEHATGFFGRPGEVPIWYQGIRTFLLCAPSLLWIGWTVRHLTRRHAQIPRTNLA